MQTVLTRTFIGISIAILISYLLHNNAQKSLFDKDVIMVVSVLSLCCAAPIILGYILSYILIQKKSPFLYLFNTFLLVLNISLIVGATLLALGTFVYAPFLSFVFVYIGIGIYVFYETVLNFNKAKAVNNNSEDEDILDNNFSN